MTHSTAPIEIPLSKKKLILLLAASMGFVAAGCWLLIDPPVLKNPFLGNPIVIFFVGIASVLFFGLCGFFIIRQLPVKKTGLIIDNNGLTDISSAVSVGQILWSDIEEISVVKIQRQRLILLKVKNAQAFIEKQPSGFKRKIMQMNLNMYGTPLSITANSLQIKFDDLLNMISQKLKEHHAKSY
jgi:hypothetical protein